MIERRYRADTILYPRFALTTSPRSDTQEKSQLYLRGFKMYSIAFLVFFCKLGRTVEKVEKKSKSHVQGGDVTLALRKTLLVLCETFVTFCDFLPYFK